MTAEFTLPEYLTRERARIENALEHRLVRAVHQLSGGPPAEVFRAGVLSGGKRIRPLLCVTAFRAVQEIPPDGSIEDTIYDLAASVEMIHAYSLMHDDLPCMDDAELRRGKATPHTLFGVEATTRSGAALIPAAAWSAWEAAVRIGGPEMGRAAVSVLMEAAGGTGMVGGQAVDLAAEGKKLDEAALTDLHGLKTGALLRASLELGALAGQAVPAVSEAMREYGSAIGLAFQIADDVLDRTGTSESLGKNPSDQAFDKSTYVSLLGVDGARARGRQQVTAAKTALKGVEIQSPVMDALADYILSRAR